MSGRRTLGRLLLSIGVALIVTKKVEEKKDIPKEENIITIKIEV